jgi:hypothetical protein
LERAALENQLDEDQQRNEGRHIVCGGYHATDSWIQFSQGKRCFQQKKKDLRHFF